MGLGEIDVALTHSTPLILCGFLFQGGAWDVSISGPRQRAPVSGRVAGHHPVRHTGLRGRSRGGKRSLAVVVGPRPAIRIAQAITVLAALAALFWQYLGVAESSFGGIAILVVPHAILLTWLLERYLRERPGRPHASMD